MKRIIGFVFAVMAAAILGVSCSNPAGAEKDVTGEYIPVERKDCRVYFDRNLPAVNMRWGCSKSSPTGITVKENSEVILPEFEGVLQEYKNNELFKTYAFESWNTEKNGTGENYLPGSHYKVLKNVTLYAVYEKNGKLVSDGGDQKEGDLDFSMKTAYLLKIGEKINLVSSINGYDVFYQVQNMDDAVSVSGSEVKAETVGEAVVVAEAWDDSSKKWYCTFTVTAEGFSGSGLDYKLIGKWIYSGGSYIVFNADKTGEMKIYLRGKLAQNTSFTWYSLKNNYGEYFVVENSSSDVNGQYTIQRIDTKNLKFKGYLAFGLPEVTEWTKE